MYSHHFYVKVSVPGTKCLFQAEAHQLNCCHFIHNTSKWVEMLLSELVIDIFFNHTRETYFEKHLHLNIIMVESNCMWLRSDTMVRASSIMLALWAFFYKKYWGLFLCSHRLSVVVKFIAFRPSEKYHVSKTVSSHFRVLKLTLE